MIFEITKLSIDEHGYISEGGSDLVAYKFNSKHIECSDKDLRSFGYIKENLLDKSKYETPLMFCVETKSLYINSLNWYRFKNTLPLDSEDNYTARFCRVDIVLSTTKPSDAFAKFKKKDMYLTCPLIVHKNSIPNIEQGSAPRGVTISPCALESREIFPKNNNIQPLSQATTVSSVVTFVMERDHFMTPENKGPYETPNVYALIDNTYHSDAASSSLYVAISGGVLFSRVICKYACNFEETVFLNFPSTPLLAGFPVQPTNTRYISKNGGSYFINQIANVVSPSGDLYSIGGYVDNSYNYNDNSYNISNYSNVKVVEFDTYAEFSTHLSSKYKTGDKILCSKLRISDFYSDRACTKLVAMRGGLSYCATLDPVNTVFLDIDNTPDIIWQDRSAYLDMSTNGDGIVYVIKQPVDYNRYYLASVDWTSTAGAYVLNIGNSMSGISVCQSGPSPYILHQPYYVVNNPISKVWIPNCMFNEMLEHFTDMEVFSSSLQTIQAIIYNKTNYYLYSTFNDSDKVSTAIKFDKTTFQPSLVGPANTANMATGSDNMSADLRKEYFDFTGVFVGSKLPTTDHPATKISEIMYYSSVAFVRFTVI